MLSKCNWPIWRLDDFSTCFQREFLQTLFPLVACGLSLLFLIIQIARRIARTPHGKHYEPLEAANGTDDTVKDLEPVNDSFSDITSINGGIEQNQLSLQKTISRLHDHDAEINRPRGVLLVISLECLAVAGQVGINLTCLALALGRAEKTAAASQLALWLYVLLLLCLRLALPHLKRNTSLGLWNHTTVLYCLQWLFTVICFRSALVHPRPEPNQTLVIANFVLGTLLAVIALMERRGNRTVILQHEDDLEPSHEPLASLLSLATFSWVNAIVWHGYWNTYELQDVWNLLPKDRAARILADFHQVKKTSMLAWRLIKFFKRELLLQQCWSFLSALLTFVPTLLLKSILEYVEQPDVIPRATAWLYVILLFVTGCVHAVADGQALWLGRQICIRLRAVMVGEIYAKTLKRRAAATSDTDMAADDKKNASEGNSKPGLKDKMLGFFGRKKKVQPPQEDQAKAGGKDSQVNSGTIINLMSVDSFKVSEISAYWHFLIPSVPVDLAIALTLLYRILGWSSIAGIGVMVCLMPVNLYFANQFSEAQKRIMTSTDARIHTTNEVLQNIRIIKYFAWEQRFARNVDEKRRVEIRALRSKFILWAEASTIWYGVPFVITGLSFFLYTVVEKKPLIPSVAFTALSLFSLLRYPLDRLADMLARVQESKVSVDRIAKFLSEEETEKYEQLHSMDGEDETRIGFENATFSWAGKEEAFEPGNAAFRMINLSVDFRVGGLNIIAGPTGSGKTSLLMALLGEMTLIKGKVRLPGGHSREDLQPDPETGLTESVAYCAQQAWLVNDTIKQNIIFASPYDEQRYRNVINACALKRDLEVLEAGDSTLVGEKGIVVSGGQKQRISLARALYSNSKHILLDDCLSAVDSHTAQHIFENCILGPLMLNRTCILVTHNVALCVPPANFVVVLANGKISAQGSPEQVISSGALGDDTLKSRPTSKGGTRPASRDASVDDLKDTIPNGSTTESGALNGHANGTPAEAISKGKIPEAEENANARTEGKAEGAVDWKVIRLYLKSMGPWYFWFAVLVAFTAEQFSAVSTNMWIRTWANTYSTQGINTLGTNQSLPSGVSSTYSSRFISGSLPTWRLSVPWGGSGKISAFSEPSETNVPYYLAIYALLAIFYLLVCLSKLAVLFKGSLNASRSVHSRLLEAVLRAKFKFFDTTPLGQIMNRFSKDLQSVDQDVATAAAGVLQSLFGIVTIVTLISVITPGFLLAGIFLTVLYFCIGMFYVRSSRDLKRIESVQRSPLYQQFGETLSGVTTIRAYGDERRFIRDNYARINTHNRPFIYLWATNRWLALRVDFAGALVSFFAGVLIVSSIGRIDAGAAGLSLTYALMFNENILWLVRLYADNEQNMNHVERIKVYLEVEQESPARIPEKRPPGNWPSRGAVEFVDYSTRYRPDLDPVLKHLNIKIQAEEKVGIVGRTGAGKSSLALALFRGLEADEGQILIDDIDIGTIGLQDLRENITIVPQDPTLFFGTIRSNLDPFGLFTDEEIFTALRRVHLIGNTSPTSASLTLPTNGVPHTLSSPMSHSTLRAGSDAGNDLTKVITSNRENVNVFLNLSANVAESGSNLSQGQRQLLCLARALLKSPRVLLMDEATASIDYATDAKIQDTLHEIKGSTIITIAHRLKTIVDYDKVLVLDKGEVVEYDAPWNLIRKEKGVFRGMCEMSGDFDTLLEGAKKAERKGRLVDVDVDE